MSFHPPDFETLRDLPQDRRVLISEDSPNDSWPLASGREPQNHSASVDEHVDSSIGARFHFPDPSGLAKDDLLFDDFMAIELDTDDLLVL